MAALLDHRPLWCQQLVAYEPRAPRRTEDRGRSQAHPLEPETPAVEGARFSE